MDFENRAKPPSTQEAREARKAQSRWDAERALKDRKKADEAFRANFERLKS
jgi:hypothetical protein